MFTLKQIKAKKEHGPTVRFRSRMQAFCHHAQTFWRAHRKSIMAFGLVLIVAGVLFPHVNLAQALGPTTPAPADDAGQKLMATLTPVLQVLRSLLWPFLLLIGNLMQNDLLFGTGMEQNLLKIWVQVRDIVNIFFVLILVGIALYNVVGGFQADFHLKSVLPKFIIGLILVNFTFLGVKVVLDGINVISTGIFALPRTVGMELNKPLMIHNFCLSLYTDKAGNYVPPNDKPLCTSTLNPTTKQYEFNPSNGKNQVNDINGYFDNIDSRNVAVVLALSFEKINLISKVADGLNQDEKADISKLVINTLLSVILYIIYASSFIALFVVLLVRVIVLWILIAISPLIALMWVLPAGLKTMMGSGGDDIKNQFVKHAIVPIPVAIALSIGTVLLNALDTTKLDGWMFSQSTWSVGLFTSGISTFQQLITAVACVAFIWKAVFDAMKDTQASAITEGIRGWVGSMGKQIAKAPLVMPLFPIGTGGKKASVMDFFLATQNAPGLMKSAETKHAQDIFPEAFSAENRAKTESENARTVAELAKSQSKQDRAAFRGQGNQQTLGAWFEKHPGELGKYLPSGYTEPQLLKALKEGSIKDPNVMDKFGERIGYIPPKSDGTPGTSPESERIKAALQKRKPGLTPEQLNNFASSFDKADEPTKKALSSLLAKADKGDDKAAAELEAKLTALAEKNKAEAAKAETTTTGAAGLSDEIRRTDNFDNIKNKIKDLKLDPKKDPEAAARIRGALHDMVANGKYTEAQINAESAIANIYKEPTPPTPAAAPKAAAGGAASSSVKPIPIKQGDANIPGHAATAVGTIYEHEGKKYIITAK